MAVSKRTRYEVLRRDSFACRYCGATAPAVKLTVDHVMPIALGGTDQPDNLVTACVDCNAGKSSTSPDSEVVADVSDGALRWAEAMKRAGTQLHTLSDEQESYVDHFIDAWDSFRQFERAIPTSPNWRAIIVGYHNAHLPVSALVDAVNIAMAHRGVHNGDRFRYFCGVVRNMLNDQATLAAQLLEKGDA